MTSSSLKRSSSLGRLADDDDVDYRYKMAMEKLRCDLVGFPYYYSRPYSAYRRPYYADLDYPYYGRWYDRQWQDWPYYDRRPWYYDDYYRDYLRGYDEGLKRYESASSLRRAASSGDLASPAAGAAAASSKEPPAPPAASAKDKDDVAADRAATSASAVGASRARSPSPLPPPPAPLPYYDRYYGQPYWYHNYYYYRQPSYYWRRYLDSRYY